MEQHSELHHHDHHDHDHSHEHHHHPKAPNPYAVPGAIVIAGALIAAALYFGGSHGSNTAAVAAGAQKPTVAVDASKVKTANEPYVGNVNAPVTMVLWTDYQCPFCKQFESADVAQLYTNYVQTGKLKIIFKDFAFLGPDSQTTAVIARAVWDDAVANNNPLEFYKWRTAIYENQGQEGSSWATQDKIYTLTTQILGAPAEARIANLATTNQAKYQAIVNADKTEGTNMGITGTPGTIIGTTFINGAQPYATVKAAVDQALAGK